MVLNAQFPSLKKSERNLLILTKKPYVSKYKITLIWDTTDCLSPSRHFLKTARLTHKTIARAHRNNVLKNARNSIKNNNY